jgi:3-oxoacyl-[acyl-carrier protein] reductase
MTDRYASFAHSGPGQTIIKRLGLPNPPRLRRYHPGDPLVPGPVLLDGAPGGRLVEVVGKLLDGAGVEQRDPAAEGGPLGGDQNPPPNAALIFDASGIADSTHLRALYDFFHPHARALYRCGRVIVLGTPPEACETPRQATAQRALEGFTRSVGKEFGRGTTSQLVYVAPGAESAIESTLRFLLSARSAYVSGQVIRVGPAAVAAPADWDRPLDERVALVTGAARGIGEAIARVLARDGAHVVCLDVPAAGDALAAVANDIGGTALQLDLTADDAPVRLAEHLGARHAGVDIVVHNAGITRDRTLARMDAARWDSVLDVNLSSIERTTDRLLSEMLIGDGARMVAVSSVSGIAGNRGQTNYATSKAGVIGLVRSLAPVLAPRGITINAVAPGHIETAMTAKMPALLREASRRMNSMAQGGLPVDVAETIAWLASPASGGVTGNVVRVCGQSLIGA